MQPLNHCRQLLRFLGAKHPKHITESDSWPWTAESAAHVEDLSALSMKFILPFGGCVLGDQELRALDDSEPLSLPFKSVALEFVDQVYEGSRGTMKVIIFAVQRDDDIAIHECSTITTRDGLEIWMRSHEQVLPRVGWMPRPDDGFAARQLQFAARLRAAAGDGQIPTSEVDAIVQTAEAASRRVFTRADLLASDLMLYPATKSVLSLLNALACANVRAERRDPKKQKVKSALPFDAYHVLTIGAHSASERGAAVGGNRSPREHLRRGHIRRLDDGRRIWVNATVVAAGRGAGVVTKEYAVRGGKQQ